MALCADTSPLALKGREELWAMETFVAPDEADVIIVLGGDGYMLEVMHRYGHQNVRIYGMNCGTVGFLMNLYNPYGLKERLEKSTSVHLHPLEMKAYDQSHHLYSGLAFNEVSLLRQTRQTAHLRLKIDQIQRLEELVCDGVLVATPAGSTAYNLSVHGPILPLGSNLLALTPISPFRPRRWKGALLPHTSSVQIQVLDSEKRPVSAVADFTEIRHVVQVEIREAQDHCVNLLFDPEHALEERFIREQFVN